MDYYNLGHAYMDLPALRDLDAAEAAYQRSLDRWAQDDLLGRSKTIKQIGMVHHTRFREAHQHGESAECVLQHARAAEQHYWKALTLCPPTAIADLGPIHNQLGNLYSEVAQNELAREHYEKCVQYDEQTGNRYGAGGTRYNLALMYFDSAEREPVRRRDLLHRALAYAQASLRDYQHYQGRAADMEARAQRFIDRIIQALGA